MLLSPRSLHAQGRTSPTSFAPNPRACSSIAITSSPGSPGQRGRGLSWCPAVVSPVVAARNISPSATQRRLVYQPAPTNADDVFSNRDMVHSSAVSTYALPAWCHGHPSQQPGLGRSFSPPPVPKSPVASPREPRVRQQQQCFAGVPKQIATPSLSWAGVPAVSPKKTPLQSKRAVRGGGSLSPRMQHRELRGGIDVPVTLVHRRSMDLETNLCGDIVEPRCKGDDRQYADVSNREKAVKDGEAGVSDASVKMAAVRKLEMQLRDEAAAHQQARIELERRLKFVNDECDAHKTRKCHLEAQLDQQSIENAKLSNQLDRRGEEMHAVEEKFCESSGRLERLEAERQAVHAQRVCQEQARARQQEREIAEAARLVDEREKALSRREECMIDQEQTAAGLESRIAELDRQRQVLEAQLKQQNKANHRPESVRQKMAKWTGENVRLSEPDLDKENRRLNEMVSDQRGMLFNLEAQLQREQITKTTFTPGEYIKMARRHEGETFAHDNAALKLKTSSLQTQVSEVQWHNELLQKHLPRRAREAVAQEMRVQTLPPP